MWMKVAPYVVILILGGLLLNAHQDLGAAVAKCNEDKAVAAATAESAARRAIEAGHRLELAQRDRMLALAHSSVAGAREAARQAEEGTAEREQRIRQLELEAETDEIPDSNECLNVYVPADSVDGVLHARTDFGPGDCRSTGSGSVCADSERTDGNDSADGDFAAVTFGDVLILWGLDRDTIETLNARLDAIRDLSDEAVTD